MGGLKTCIAGLQLPVACQSDMLCMRPAICLSVISLNVKYAKVTQCLEEKVLNLRCGACCRCNFEAC